MLPRRFLTIAALVLTACQAGCPATVPNKPPPVEYAK